MRRLIAPFLALALAAGCDKAKPQPTSHREPPAAAVPSKPAAPRATYTELAAKEPIAAQLAAGATAAKAAGLEPYAYLHASWCGPCKAIAATRESDPMMQEAFAGTALLAIDIDDVAPAELASNHLPAGAIPVFYRLDAQGVATGDSIDGGAWGDNIPANMAPPLAAFFKK